MKMVVATDRIDSLKLMSIVRNVLFIIYENTTVTVTNYLHL